MTVNMDQHWKLRIVDATRGNQTMMGALVLAILNVEPNKRPFFRGLGTIDKDGVVWAMLYAKSMIMPRLTPLGTVQQVMDELRALADHAKMDEREAEEFFTEVRKWIVRDQRAKSELN